MNLLEKCLLYYNNNLTNNITEKELDDDKELRFTLLDMQTFAELYCKERCDINCVNQRSELLNCKKLHLNKE